MAKSTRKRAARASVRKTDGKAARSRATHGRARSRTRPARTRAAAAAELVAVTMTIDVPGGAPPDFLFVRRMAGVERPNGQASLPHATHTAGWDVVSPTVRPLTFDVTITRDATGTVVLNRAGEKTGADGKGSGADTFTV